MVILHSSTNLFGIALVVLIAVLLSPAFSQTDGQPDSSKNIPQSATTVQIKFLTKPIDQEKMTNDDWLGLRGRIPAGISYKRTKELFPNLGELTTEGAGAFNPKYGLYEAYLSFSIFEYPARMEFNYRGDSESSNSLGTYYFQVNSIDSVTAETIYFQVRDFYNNLYGPYDVESEEEYYLNETCFWKVNGVNPGVTKQIYSTKSAYVGW